MRVALDARCLQDRPLGGIGRGLANLVPRLAGHVELTLLTDARRPAFSCAVDQQPLRAWPARGSAWLQLAVPRRLRRFDGLFHCPFYGLPYRQPVPMVVTIHDLTFEHFPEWFSAARRLSFRAQARHAARSARRILTDSEHVRSDVIETYAVPGERVLVAPFAVDPAFTEDVEPSSLAGVLAAAGVRGPYVLALGGAPRRALDVAVRAWELVRESGIEVSLVVVGPELPPPAPGLFAVGPVDDAQWRALLAGAAAFCYPTRYEGFGMPGLEAAAVGTPVVCAPVGSLPEVLGDAAEWCEEPEPEAVAAALSRVLVDHGRAATLAAAGRRRVREGPGWDHAADIVLRAYRESLDG